MTLVRNGNCETMKSAPRLANSRIISCYGVLIIYSMIREKRRWTPPHGSHVQHVVSSPIYRFPSISSSLSIIMHIYLLNSRTSYITPTKSGKKMCTSRTAHAQHSHSTSVAVNKQALVLIPRIWHDEGRPRKNASMKSNNSK